MGSDGCEHSLEAESLGFASATAVVLAGGLGTRLRSLIADRPKVLAPVRGRPFLEHLLDQLADSGIERVVLCTGYRGEQVQATFGDSYRSLRLVYSREAVPLGTAGALRSAIPLFESDPVLVMNGDSLSQVNLKELWTWHRAKQASATVLLTCSDDTRRYGRAQVDVEGRVLAFVEKGHEAGPGWISAGVYVLDACLLRTIPGGRYVSLEQDVFPALLECGLYGYRSSGRMLDIGTPESYAAAERFLHPGANTPYSSEHQVDERA